MCTKNGRFLIYSRKSIFKILIVVVVQFRQTYFKNQKRYRSETMHDDWNPWQVVHNLAGRLHAACSLAANTLVVPLVSYPWTTGVEIESQGRLTSGMSLAWNRDMQPVPCAVSSLCMCTALAPFTILHHDRSAHARDSWRWDMSFEGG